MNSKKKIHVFTSDILPFPGGARSAGGDRSFQLISALRDAGHEVTYSMCLTTYLAATQRDKIVANLSADELWYCDHIFEPDVVLARVQPDIAIFCNVNAFLSLARYARDIVHILDMNGPIHLEGLLIDAENIAAASQDAELLEKWSSKLVAKLRAADYIITTSERQKYFWVAYCSLAGFSFNELNPLVCPISYSAPVLPRNPSKNVSVVFSGGFYPWQQPDRFLLATAEYLDTIDGSVFHIFGGVHTGHPNAGHVKELLTELQRYKCVKYHGYRPIEDLMAVLSQAWCAVELMDRNIERELAITGRTVGYLSAGAPVIYNNYSSLSELVARYQAGWTIDTADTTGIVGVLRQLVEGGLPLVERLSKQAQELAAAEFNCKNNMAPLIDLCSGPVQRRRSRQSQAGRGRAPGRSLGKVLIISEAPDGHAILELRISNPMRALQRQGLIDSFTISPPRLPGLERDASFYDVIVVQRTVPKWCYQALSNLGVPFVLEVDDNLLARAAYREGGIETDLQLGLRLCTTVTAPNPRLIRMLEKYSGLRLAHKASMAPNSLPYSGKRLSAEKPSSILWIQSDIAALTNSKEAVVTAVEEFSSRNKLPLMLVGRNVLNRPQFTYQRVMGEISFVANLQLLEYFPTSIGVCPLETVADEQTIDFVSGKSDLKILLFDGYGHPGIYSNAAPYTESSLRPDGLIIENSYTNWSEALLFQYEEGWRRASDCAARIQDERHVNRVVREAWLPALQSSALSRPICGAELYKSMEGFHRFGALPEQSMGYVLAHEDLRNCMMADNEWTYEHHYNLFGRHESRYILHSAEAHDSLLATLAKQSEDTFEELKSKSPGRPELDELRLRLASLEAAEKASRSDAEDLRASYSWKLTAPLRTIAKPFME